MKRNSLKNVLYLGISLLLLVTTLLVFCSLLVLGQLDAQTDRTTQTMQVQLALRSLHTRLVEDRAHLRGYVLSGKPFFVEDYDITRTRALLSDLKTLVQDNNPGLMAQVHDLEELVEQYSRTNAALYNAMREGRREDAVREVGSGTGKSQMDQLRRILTEMDDAESANVRGTREQMDRLQLYLYVVLGFGLALCLITGLTALKILARRLEPLMACATFAESVGQGDLNVAPLPVGLNDEVGLVSESLNTMQRNLRQLTQNTREVANRLGAATHQILAGAQQQAASVQQQMAAVQQTSATMEELGQSAIQVVERSRQVASRAEANQIASEGGLKSVRESVEATAATLEQVRVVASKILSLNEKTQAIGAIVSTVQDLSERSNVLALNAAILAAASTEARSFTVVAQEMKSLAEQSKRATVEVRGLLGDIERGIQACVFLTEEAVRRGEMGTTHMDSVNDLIQRLAADVQDSLGAFQQIVAATHQQQLAFEQVTQALFSIRQASQQTVSSTRQFELSAQELHDLSRQMLQTFERYRIHPAES